ncbi:MAG: hypothetical protein ACJ71R_16445 [Nitrososphaeraceae archaeon]
MDIVAPNPLPKIDTSIKPREEEQLAHVVESMPSVEPENNEAAVVNGQCQLLCASTDTSDCIPHAPLEPLEMHLVTVNVHQVQY